MRRWIRRAVFLTCAVIPGAAVAARMSRANDGRPAITGISNMAVYTSDAEAAEHFYVFDLGFTKAADPENAAGARYYASATQFIEVLPLPANAGPNRLDHQGYQTADAERLREYLQASGYAVPPSVEKGPDASAWFYVKDPEGNRVEFVQAPAGGWHVELTGDAISRRIIHVGMRVHSAEAENALYRRTLGFRPYWYGGAKDGEIDWVSQQTPEGANWLEYMLEANDGSQQALGGMNHFSLGVASMKDAVAKLTAEGRLSTRHSGPRIGHDGKWQDNLFDPDGTRVELMEFTPAGKTCCSAFTAEHPKP